MRGILEGASLRTSSDRKSHAVILPDQTTKCLAIETGMVVFMIIYSS